MKRHQKSYDVKSFLNKKKNKKSFVSLIFTRMSVLRLVYGVVLGAVIIFLIVISDGVWSGISGAGVSHALPFFSSVKGRKQTVLSASELVFSRAVSPLFRFDKSAPKEEPPPKPNVNIEERSVVSEGLNIKNETDYSLDIPNILSEEIELSTANPKVLIVHTHGSESYTSSKKYSYQPTGNYRTQDTQFNMIRVGEKLAEILRQNGIEVIHDKTINDYPSYNDSYNKTQKVIEDHLSKDSDIAFVFDIHRDAVGEGDNIVKFTADIHGKKAAQVMMVCGTDSNLPNPDWKSNLTLALRIQNELETMYPGFLRPLNIRKERFNMHLTKGSILFEVGTNGNTLDEALVAAGYLGEGLSKVISSFSR